MKNRNRTLGLFAIAGLVSVGFAWTQFVGPALERARQQRAADRMVATNLVSGGGLTADDAERITVLSRECFQGRTLDDEERQYIMRYIDRNQEGSTRALKLTLAYSLLRDDARHSRPDYAPVVVSRMRQILQDPEYTKLQTNVRGALWVLRYAKASL